MSELFDRLEISETTWVAGAYWHRAETSTLLFLFHLCRVRLHFRGEWGVELGRCWPLSFSLLGLAALFNLSNRLTANHYSSQTTTCFLSLAFRNTSNLSLVPYTNCRRRLTAWFCSTSSRRGWSMATHLIYILRLISLAQKVIVIFEEYFYVFVELFFCNFVIIKHSYNILKELICDRKLIL